MRTIFPLHSPVSRGVHPLVFASVVVLAAALCATQIHAAQAPQTALPSAPAHKQAHPRKHPIKTKKLAPAEEASVPVAPPAPEAPKWPANEKPVPASVTWDSHGLRIEAANSSLARILADVATATGAKVEGFNTDQRIFGVYGPGPAREVLSQLLLGSGYNVVMIGDQGQGTPREIVLSDRHSGTASIAPNAASASDEDTDNEEQGQQAQPSIRPGFGPSGPLHIPQQMPARPMPGQQPNPQS
jgi:hypothetical protein